MDPASAPRGVLRPVPGETDEGGLTRVLAPPELAGWLEWVWIVRWDLRADPPQRRHTLPDPSVHLVADAGRSGVFGPVRRRFTTTLAGRGVVVGVKFRPGAFRPLLGGPVARIADAVLDPAPFFGLDAPAYERRVLGAADPADAAFAVVRAALPAPDPEVARVAGIVGRIAGDRTVVRVEHVAAREHTSVRSLQRLFAEYVGLSPKAVIRRHRLQDVALAAHADAPPDWAALALELGYSDQAHLVRDFSATIGVPPGAYRNAWPSPR